MAKKEPSPEERERRFIQSMVSKGISPARAHEKLTMMRKAKANKKRLIGEKIMKQVERP